MGYQQHEGRSVRVLRRGAAEDGVDRLAALDKHQWHDEAWMEARAKTDWLQEPVSIYEVHLESWLRGPERVAHAIANWPKSWSAT